MSGRVRVSVDLPRDQIGALAKLGERVGSSRAALVRKAVAEYLERQPRSLDESFGLWRTQSEPEDGAAYQERLRREWE